MTERKTLNTDVFRQYTDSEKNLFSNGLYFYFRDFLQAYAGCLKE